MLTFIAGMALVAIGSPQTAYAETVSHPWIETSSIATTTPDGVAAMVKAVQVKYGLGDDFFYTAKCESKFNAGAVGDYGTSFGIFQIHRPAHPDITKAQALDPHWAAEWAAQQFLAGKQRMWTCWRVLYA